MADNHILERAVVTREGKSAEEDGDCIAVTSGK